VVAAAAQFVKHLIATVDRVDVHLAKAAISVVETDTAQATKPTPY